MNHAIPDIIDLDKYPLENDNFRASCKRMLNENGILVMRNFLLPVAIASIQSEAAENQHLAYYTTNSHNIYLTQYDVIQSIIPATGW